MSGSWDRSTAMLDVTSVLGDKVLYATAVTVNEAISSPFDIHVTLVSQQDDIQANAVLHQPMTIHLRHAGAPIRHFHGIVQSFSADGPVGGRQLYVYKARLVPRCWFLSQTADCRIFQKRTLTEIIQMIFREGGLTAPRFQLKTVLGIREYTTQYNETDLDFISRLMQEEGAFYYFKHTSSDHEMVITDHNGTFPAIASSPLRFDSVSADDSVLTGWQRPHGTTHGNMRQIDYDPTDPAKRLDVQQRTVLSAGGTSSREVFHWPALSHDPSRVSATTRFRMEASEASVSLFHGAGRCRDMIPAATFVLTKDPITGDSGKTYAIQSVAHEMWDDTFLNDGGGSGYQNRFTAFPTDVTWREPFSIPRPRMDGVHAAIVIGPGGTEIHTDEHGRVKVRFFWDHRAEAHPDNAVWARVVYPWAGNGWGWQSTPRVGTEVAVAFMDGDVDRPVVLGGMYNGQDKPIYPPGERTKSGIRTRSSLGGGASNFNELTFDDKAGSELLFIQAEKDMTTKVKNNQTLTVGNNRTGTIQGGNDALTINKGNRDVKLDKGNDSLLVSMGNLDIKAALGKIDIEAMQSITLKVGTSSVKIDQTGVTIKGLVIKSEATAMLQTKAPITMFKADGLMMLKAGIMLLN